MADKKKRGGLLGIAFGVDDPKASDDDEEKPSTAKGRAMKAMHEAMHSGDFEEAAHQFQSAYDLCAMGEEEEYEGESASEADPLLME